MRCFLYVSLLLLLAACNRQVYKNQSMAGSSSTYTASALTPRFEKQLYRCVVNGRIVFKKYHLSGILFLKQLPDSTTRVLFQGEMGNTYFDLGWDKNDSFQVFRIIDQMNKPALIRTLKKDFELLLVKHVGPKLSGVFHYNRDTSETYLRFPLEKGFVHYVTDSQSRLIRIENADERQKVVIMTFKAPTPLRQLPEEMTIDHLRASFRIDLKKISDDDIAE